MPPQNKITVRFMMHHSIQTHQHFCPKISIQAEFESFMHLSRIYKCMNSYRAGAGQQFMHPSPGSSWKKAQCKIHLHCFHLGSPRQVGGKPSYCTTEPLYFKYTLEYIYSLQHCRRPIDADGLLLQRFQELVTHNCAVF